MFSDSHLTRERYGPLSAALIDLVCTRRRVPETGENNPRAFQLLFSFPSKPEELPGALSQNRGLERKAAPLPAHELTPLEVKSLQTEADGLPSQKPDHFTSLASKRGR